VATEPATEYSFEGPAAFELQAEKERVAGLGPWRLGLRRLRRNKGSLAFGGLFIVIVLLCLLAPVWANDFAHTGPFKNHLTDTVVIDGKKTDVVSTDGVPIGPTWQSRFLLGADDNGRDIAVRLLYGGRTSLEIGIFAALITAFLAVIVGLLAGYFRGWTDTVVSRVLDVIWAYPVVLLGVALGTALNLGGLHLGPISVGADSKMIPIIIIAVVYVPYMARPIRGQVLGLREKEFVEAARSLGAPALRQVARHILPNALGPVIVAGTIDVAAAIIAESSLSFLGLGFPPDIPTWGRILFDAKDNLDFAPHWAIFPGTAIFLTVVSINYIGDGLRDALDPRKILG
jgi:peptide/nickel transport system permease protein